MSPTSKPYERFEDEEYEDIGLRSNVEYAGFWLRFCAAFLDGLILYAINFAIAFFFLSTSAIVPVNGVRTGGPIMIQILGIVIGWLYEAVQESSPAQATVGKRAVGIVVTDLDGKRISFGQATGRHFGKIISALPLGIGFIMAGFTEKKQALHDLMAGTLVVRRDSALSGRRSVRDDSDVRTADQDDMDDRPRLPDRPDERIR